MARLILPGDWDAFFFGSEEIIFDQDPQLCLQVRAHQSASADLQSLADQRSRPDLHGDQQRADLQSDWRSQANLQSDQRARADQQSDQRAWFDLQCDKRARADLRARKQQSRLDLLVQLQGGELAQEDQLARLDPQAGLRIRVRIKLSCQN
jgi:hypothetical protein